jgi:hypothetical protein
MRQATGLSMYTRDEVFEELEAMLIITSLAIEKLIKALEDEFRFQKDYLLEWKHSIDVFVNCGQFERMKEEASIAKLRELFDGFLEPAQEALKKGHIQVILECRKVLTIFEDPWTVIRKRYELLLDHDRCRDMRKKGLTPDAKLIEGEQAYLSINAQLIEDLPVFLEYVAAFIGVCLEEWFDHLIRHFERMAAICVEGAFEPLKFEVINQFHRYHARHSAPLLKTSVVLQDATRSQGNHQSRLE